MKNWENMTHSKKQNKSLVSNHKEMEKYELPDEKFKVIVLKKLSELPYNTYRQLLEIRKIKHEQNQNINNEKLQQRTKQKF